MKTALLLLAALPALAVAMPAPPRRPAAPVQSITYETGPCFGACPVYRLTINSTGSGTFEGLRFTRVTGMRAFRFRPADYQAFARALAPLRPARGSVRYTGERCRAMATDMPSTEVTWRDRRGPQTLYFYFGCDMQRNRAIAERLRAAPQRLPIGDFIGPRR
jgi:hypothetical protein